MKVAASIFSWLGGALSAILGVVTASLIANTEIVDEATSTSYKLINNPLIVWIPFAIILVLKLAILIWRQKSAAKGNKVACGVCTLLFVSLVGGILTLCIPKEGE